MKRTIESSSKSGVALIVDALINSGGKRNIDTSISAEPQVKKRRSRSKGAQAEQENGKRTGNS